MLKRSGSQSSAHLVVVGVLFVVLSCTPLQTHAASGFFGGIWCDVSAWFGFMTDSCLGDVPVVIPVIPEVVVVPPSTVFVPVPARPAVFASSGTVSPIAQYITNSYITNPVTIIREEGTHTIVREGSGGSSGVSDSSFSRQVEAIYNSLSQTVGAVYTSIAEAITTIALHVTGDTLVDGLLTANGGASITGTLTINGNTVVTGGGSLSVGDKIVAPGEIGIGTSTPGAKLAIQSTNPAQKAILLYGATTTPQTANFFDVYDSPSGNNNLFTLTAAGRLGLATSTPSQLLSVHGNSYISGTSFFGGAITGTSTLNITGLTTLANATTTQLTVTGSTYLATISGNVGIGTTSPVSKLSVLGESAFAGGASVGIGYAGTAAPTGGMIIQGNVGIGTTSPSSLLSVHGNALISGTSFFGGALTGTSTLNITGLTTLANATTTQLTVTGSTYLATISGNVGIGTTNPITRFVVNTGTDQNFKVRAPLSFATGIVIDSANSADNVQTPMELRASIFDFVNGGGAVVVGIGQVAPGSTLSVNGGISAGTYSATASPSNGMIISGNVGIGTTTPGALFSVHGAGLISSNLTVGGALIGTSTLNITGLTTLANATTTQLTVDLSPNKSPTHSIPQSVLRYAVC